MPSAKQLGDLVKLDIYDASVSEAAGQTYFLARRGAEKLVGCVGDPCLWNVQKLGELGGRCVCVGPADHANAQALRQRLAWTAPRCVGLATSAGLGDRLGLATPAHVRAVRGTGLAPVLAQQSIREMTRTQRSADEVMDAATWGVFQEGWRDGFGSDADHLQKIENIDYTFAAGFTMFTIDPGAHVNNHPYGLAGAEPNAAFAALDFAALETSAADMRRAYADKSFPLHGGGEIRLSAQDLARAAVKYGRAVAHTAGMYRHLAHLAGGRPFELEVSVDETDSPTTPAEHYLFASELKRLGVKWVSMAPRFVGRFEKGVDYIGSTEVFRQSFAQHVAVMRTLGPYKISIHSGSDKFSIYPIVAELAGPYVHLKTAGTSYLEALRAIATSRPALFREILDFARLRYDTDKASYHVSASVAKVPSAEQLKDAQLPELLGQFDARQVLHCTFGSVLTLRDPAGRLVFRDRLLEALRADEETHYRIVEAHLRKHLTPFAG